MKLSDKIQIMISIVAVILSVTAIVVSVYSNSISRNAHTLAIDNFNADRRIAVRTIRKKDYIKFSPLESGQQIHNMKVFFPSELHLTPFVMTPPELKIFDVALEAEIKNLIKREIPPMKGYSQVALSYPVPALNVIHGYSKGYASESIGVYDFIYSLNLVEDSIGLRLKCAVLNNFYFQIKDPQELIDSIFKKSREIISSKQNAAGRPEELTAF